LKITCYTTPIPRLSKHPHIPPNSKPSIAGGFAVGDFNNYIHFMSVFVFAAEVAFFGGVVDEYECGAGI